MKVSHIHLLLIVALALMTAVIIIAISPLLIQQLSKIVISVIKAQSPLGQVDFH